jgi:Zn-dependent protease/predicted transcriptional regulator
MSVKIGKISGINIKLNYSWFFIFLIITWSLATAYLPYQYPGRGESFYWSVGAASALFLYVSILIHELAHSTVAMRNGLNINSITLHFFGGVSEINEETTDPKTEAIMAAVGPISSLLIGVLLLAISSLFGNILPDYIEAVIFYSGYVNIALCLFNLIPAFPMDGGRVFRAILWARNGNIVKSTRTASRVAEIISVLFMGYGFFSFLSWGSLNGLWFIFIGFFINGSSQAGLSQTVISEALGEMHVKDMMTRDVHSVEPDVTLQLLIEEWFNVYKHQGYPVTRDGKLVGIITNEDVRKVEPERRTTVTVGEVMERHVVFATPDEKAGDALLNMSKNNVGRLPVVEDGELVGIITRSDFNKVIQMKTQFKQ